MTLPQAVAPLSLRPYQEDAVAEITAQFDAGAKVVYLDAPTGAGKTFIAEGYRQAQAQVQARARAFPAIYTCTEKVLQDQVLRDFPWAKVIKGRANYPTRDHPEATCDLCNVRNGACSWCSVVEECPYRVALNTAAGADLAVANTAYLLNALRPRKSQFRDWPLVIIDEADRLEEEIKRHYEVVIPRWLVMKLQDRAPRKVTVPGSWVEWLGGQVTPALDAAINTHIDHTSLNGLRRLNAMRQLSRDVDSIIFHGMEGWVLTDEKSTRPTFKPVMVDELVPEVLWRHARRWLLMSATPISVPQAMADLGVEPGAWASVTVPSQFDAARRPVYLRPAATITYQTEDIEAPKMADGIAAVLAEHPDDRVLIHSHSYRLTETLNSLLIPRLNGRLRFTYGQASQRATVLEHWLKSTNGVLLAPSMERGIDLADDKCRVMIVAKIPFPSLGDRMVSKRLHGPRGRTWYRVETIRALVQMTGRAMRHADDSCQVYVLDGSFTRVWAESKRLFPRWWREAVVGATVTERKETPGPPNPDINQHQKRTTPMAWSTTNRKGTP